MLVLAGFSFFYTFMRKYAYSAISHTFLITVLAVQWTILPLIFWQNVDDGGDWARGDLTILSLIDGYYGATACLVTFGFLLGKATPLQLVFLTLFGTSILVDTAHAHIDGHTTFVQRWASTRSTGS